MAEITLLRHGQASFGAENYDQLSDIGHQQAKWLGNHFKALGLSFDRIVTGTMLRHHQTAEGVLEGLGLTTGKGDISRDEHAGLNEYDFQGLLEPLKQQHSDQWVQTGNAKRDYYYNMKQALSYWMDGSIETDGNDSWPSFRQRIQSGFDYAHDSSAKKILVVSSGGPISVILAEVLGLDHQRTCDLTLQIKNSSTSKLLFRRPTQRMSDFTVDSFNDVSHLAVQDRQHSITFS